jgi:hypothetical protein
MLGLLALKVFKDILETMDRPARPVRTLPLLAQQGRQDNKELRAIMARKVQLDLRAFKEFKVSKATLAQQGRQAHNLPLPVLPERRAILDQPARPEQLARPLRLPDQLAQLERKVCRAMLDPQEHRVTLEALVLQAHKVFKANREFKELPVLLEA